MRRQYRYCNEEGDCAVKYRVDSCELKNFGKIYQSGSHNHLNNLENGDKAGLSERFKKAIEKILEFNPQEKPNIVRRMLNTQKEKFDIVGETIPDLAKIQRFVKNCRNKQQPNSNKIEDVKQKIIEHMYFHGINDDVPFFFWL
jgi:hypothetical protein